MKNYRYKTLTDSFNSAIQKVVNALREEGFVIITEINVNETLRKKLYVNF